MDKLFDSNRKVRKAKSDIRARAIMWWRGLSQEEKVELAHRHKPAWHFEMVDKSSNMIEEIWCIVRDTQREHP